MFELHLKPGTLTLPDLRRVLREPVRVTLDPKSSEAIRASRELVEEAVAEGKTVYGINTGFGLLARQKIESKQLEKLQENLILSHCTGTGPMLEDPVVRLMMVLKVNALAQGYSGIRMEVIETFIGLINNGIHPRIPAKGSVGASGDLAPLAHMSLALLGQGEVSVAGKVVPAAEALKKAGLKPVVLAAKEGLALINGTQASAALALTGFFAAEDCLAASLLSGALSVEAAKGSATPFRAEIQAIRRQKGQIKVGAKLTEFLRGSPIMESHANCGKVQDPYCLRCMPQVLGACLDAMNYAAEVLETEANAVTDNPLTFVETGEVISGGNFHAEPVAIAADTLALAIAEIGSIAERRIAMLIDPNQSGLPAFLVRNPGINSGFMIAHVTAAALASENKQKSHPASVDSIPTSANQEDHVSMATHGARRLIEMAENTATIVAIELLAAAQGIEFHRPLKSTACLEDLMGKIRARVLPYDEDRYFASDIEAMKLLVMSGELTQRSADILPSGKIAAA